MRGTPVRVSRRRRGLLPILVLLATSAAWADSGRPDAVALAPADRLLAKQVIPVTWTDIARLVEQDPRLAADDFRVEAVRAGWHAAGAVPNPTLEGKVDQGLPRGGGASRTEWELALSLPLGWMAQRRARLDAAAAEIDVALAESKALRRDVLLQLQTLFWNTAYEQARVASIEALESQTSSLVQTVRRRVEKGEVRPVEATRVEIELEKVTNELEAARAALASRQRQLALWLKVPGGRTIVVVADLASLPASMAVDTALATVRNTHPALAAARARTRTLEADVSIEAMARVPAFTVTGFTLADPDQRAYGVGLAVDLPIWNWNTGRLAQAEAKLAAGQKDAEAIWLDLETMLIEVQSGCDASLAAATRFKDNVVPRCESAAATMEKTYQLGEASLLEVIDARRTLIDSRRLYLSALAQAHIDCSRLSALVGEELP